ncbi:hypothetical protein RCCGE510_20814 [Rhizobium sp. CCGE 510]|nr:hypothetical protein RCCGE510_20814 [Rhizobium sp. CCGE 510]
MQPLPDVAKKVAAAQEACWNGADYIGPGIKRETAMDYHAEIDASGASQSLLRQLCAINMLRRNINVLDQ